MYDGNDQLRTQCTNFYQYFHSELSLNDNGPIQLFDIMIDNRSFQSWMRSERFYSIIASTSEVAIPQQVVCVQQQNHQLQQEAIKYQDSIKEVKQQLEQMQTRITQTSVAQINKMVALERKNVDLQSTND
jgi:hypothetical protein